ncbi:FAD binding domain-containing protein [Cognatishimia sp. F0-27]|nr:FAD binding domain-containing protein [Cognatishimia sp. F0-27]
MGYHRPHSVEAALALLADGAAPIAGGTDWYPARGAAPLPADVLDLTALDGFGGIRRVNDGWEIGALTTWTEILRADLPPAFDGLKAAAREVGSVQIQNAGTLGGNLCNASPAADGVPPLLCLNAEVSWIGPTGPGRAPLGRFLTGVRQTALPKGALLRAVHIPDPGAARGSFLKLGARKYLVISIAMVSALVSMKDGRIDTARVAVGACSAVAQRLPALEAALTGAAPDEILERMTPAQVAPLSPIDDIRGDAGYRRDAAGTLIARAIARAVPGQGGQHG